MSRVRVEVLTHSIPVANGDGGQQRIAALFSGLDQAGLIGRPTFFLWAADAAVMREARPDLAPDILTVEGVEHEYVWWLHEYFLGLRAADDADLVRALAARLDESDVLVIDHLWGWALARRAIAASGFRGTLVYHAHNAEARARRLALSNDALTPVGLATLGSLDRYEADLCGAADLVVACTDDDGVDLQSRGAKCVAVIPNGANLMSLPKVAQTDRFLFVASAWHPNGRGFSSLVLRALETLASPVAIDVVGGVGGTIDDDVKRSRERWLAEHDVRLHGRVSSDVLAGLYASCAAVLVPLQMGTGSCIKTAEALVNGLPAISSRIGARGFEGYIAQRQHAWKIADTPLEWAVALQNPQQFVSARYLGEASLEWSVVARLLGDVLSAQRALPLC